jgi:MFS family permease
MPQLIPTDALAMAHTIQLAVTPVFLLSGLAALLNVFAGRLARAVDRSRVIQARFPELDRDGLERARDELRTLDRRMRLITGSILLSTMSAVAVCLVVTLLFVSRLAGGGYARTVAVLFIAAMALLVAALVLFLVEVRLGNAAIRLRHEWLEQGGGREGNPG